MNEENIRMNEHKVQVFSPLDYKGISVRGLAVLIDQVLIALVTLPLALVFRDLSEDTLLAFAAVIYLFYHILFEYKGGQTLGKKLFKIKVAMEDGKKCTLKGAVVRNLGRIIDVALGGYILGIISIALSSKRQRIGDHMASTVVVGK